MCIDVLDTSIVSLSLKKKFKKIFLEHLKVPSDVISQVDKYILANINSVSSRVIFSFFFCLHPLGQTFLYPSNFCNHLKHSAK